MTPTKPLPCPFCGSAPEVGPINPKRDGDAWGYVACINTACPAQPKVEDGCDVSDKRGSAAYQQLAIARWNQGRR